MSFIIFFSYLFALALFDWKKKLLPLEPMMIATIVALMFRAFFGSGLSSLVGLLTGSGFIWIQVWISKGKWMGRGDIWFAASIGAFLCWPGIAVSLYLTYTVGGVLAILLFVLGIYQRGMRIPFAQFLTLGAVGAAIWGDAIAHWFQAGFGLV